MALRRRRRGRCRRTRAVTRQAGGPRSGVRAGGPALRGGGSAEDQGPVAIAAGALGGVSVAGCLVVGPAIGSVGRQVENRRRLGGRVARGRTAGGRVAGGRSVGRWFAVRGLGVRGLGVGGFAGSSLVGSSLVGWAARRGGLVAGALGGLGVGGPGVGGLAAGLVAAGRLRGRRRLRGRVGAPRCLEFVSGRPSTRPARRGRGLIPVHRTPPCHVGRHGTNRPLTTPRAKQGSVTGSSWASGGRVGVVVELARMVGCDVILELVARPEPQLAVGALAYVCHAVQCRAATFPAVANQAAKPKGDVVDGHL